MCFAGSFGEAAVELQDECEVTPPQSSKESRLQVPKFLVIRAAFLFFLEFRDREVKSSVHDWTR